MFNLMKKDKDDKVVVDHAQVDHPDTIGGVLDKVVNFSGIVFYCLFLVQKRGGRNQRNIRRGAHLQLILSEGPCLDIDYVRNHWNQ